MGFITIPLFLIGLLGWYYIAELSFFFLREYRFRKWYQQKTEKIAKPDVIYKDKSFFKTYLFLIKHYQHIPIEAIEEQIEKKLGFILTATKQKLLSIQIFAMVAPLLGLLGTVNGMIVTFQLISYYGNTSPILLSDGISEALLTTQSGLVIAFPLLILHVFLRNRSKNLENYMQEALAKLKNGEMLNGDQQKVSKK